MSNKPVIETTALTKTFNGHKALDNLNLTVKEGEVVCLLGANGAGKSTTIKLLLGFLSPCSGEVKILGYPLKQQLSQARSVLGYVAEVVNLYPLLTGRENIEFFHSLSGNTRLEESKIRELMDKLDFPMSALDRQVSGYSKGMRQKIGLAIAIAKKAKAILLDEPLSGLDPKAANDLVQALKVLSDEGVALLISSHDIFRAKQLAHRAIIMVDGQVKADLNIEKMTASMLEELYLEKVAEIRQ